MQFLFFHIRTKKSRYDGIAFISSVHESNAFWCACEHFYSCCFLTSNVFIISSGPSSVSNCNLMLHTGFRVFAIKPPYNKCIFRTAPKRTRKTKPPNENKGRPRMHAIFASLNKSNPLVEYEPSSCINCRNESIAWVNNKHPGSENELDISTPIPCSYTRALEIRFAFSDECVEWPLVFLYMRDALFYFNNRGSRVCSIVAYF